MVGLGVLERLVSFKRALQPCLLNIVCQCMQIQLPIRRLLARSELPRSSYSFEVTLWISIIVLFLHTYVGQLPSRKFYRTERPDMTQLLMNNEILESATQSHSVNRWIVPASPSALLWSGVCLLYHKIVPMILCRMQYRGMVNVVASVPYGVPNSLAMS